MSERDRPMPMAEFDDCCGQLERDRFAFGDRAEEDACQNCPLVIKRKRERVLRQARAS